MKKRQNRRGLLTVEAALILPLFIVVMCFVLNLMNLFYFHLVMQQAVSNVGRTIAQYGYVIDKTIGLDKFALQEKTKETEQALVTNVDAMVSDAKEVAGYLKGGLKVSQISEIISKGESFKKSLDNVTDTLKDLKDNPETIVNYLLVSAMNGADDYFMKWMIGDYLNEVGAVIGSIDDIEYMVYLESGTKDIIFVVQYRYSLPFAFFEDLHLQQAMRIHPWVGGDTKGAY
ncbi:MAG: TadE/TadG family type IV pilus assembly protein [Lachnospiraceae bacterium]|nr:TadE/TadG family type IV pilus assembly protein [Lachnospiraceae bacterium]